MTRFRPAVLLAAALLAGGLAAGCSTTTNNGGGSTTATAKSELHDAVQKLAETTSKLDVQFAGDSSSPAGTMNVTGNLDPKGGKSSLSMGVSGLSLEIRLLPDAIYMKFAGGATVPGIPTGWMKLDRSRLPSGLSDTLNPDAAMGADRFVSAIETASKTGTGEYSGTMNIGKAAGTLGLSSAEVAQIPEADRIVPFTASVNADGYLTKMTVTMKISGKNTTISFAYSDFGQPVDVPVPPANEVSDAPDLLYTALSSIG